jgi:hypothetical protein
VLLLVVDAVLRVGLFAVVEDDGVVSGCSSDEFGGCCACACALIFVSLDDDGDDDAMTLVVICVSYNPLALIPCNSPKPLTLMAC